MRRTALFDVNFADTKMASQTVGFDQRGVPFAEGHYVFRIEFGQNNFFPCPNAARAAAARIKETFPIGGWSLFQCVDIMRDLEQAAAGLTRVNDLVQFITDTAPREALKPSAKLHICRLLNRKAHLRSLEIEPVIYHSPSGFHGSGEHLRED